MQSLDFLMFMFQNTILHSLAQARGEKDLLISIAMLGLCTLKKLEKARVRYRYKTMLVVDDIIQV